VGGQRYAPAALPPGKTRYPLYRRLGGYQGRSGLLRKISLPLGFDPRTVHPVGSRSTDWTIPAPYIYIYIYKVKWYRYRPRVAQRVGRGIALLFHDRGPRRGWVVSSTPRPHFTPGKDPVPILQEAGWAPGPVWAGGKSRPRRDSIPDRPARSQSLYRLSYRAHTHTHTHTHTHIYIYIYIYIISTI